jgi:hypothetical protein
MERLNHFLAIQFKRMCATGKLYKSALSGSEVWKIYLSNFKPETDPVFRDPESSTHDCNTCNNFIRRYGNIVAVDEDLNIMTLFDRAYEMDPEVFDEYSRSTISMGGEILKHPIKEVFFETYNSLNSLPYESCKKNNEVFKLGIASNVKKYSKAEALEYGVVKEGEIRTFHHFNLDLPKQFVKMTDRSIEAIQADFRSSKEVFLRAMNEIPLDTLNLVIDLINQGSLLNGEAHLEKVITIKNLKEEFDKIDESKASGFLRDNWAWDKSYNLGIAKFKNELVGVLCSEIAQGEDLNKACKSWNRRVDPANYMRAVAPITEAQKKNAQKFVEENGYVESFDRRLAVLDDIRVGEILHSNVGNGGIKKVSIFDNVKTKSTVHKKGEFKNIEEVSIDKFMKDILPGCTSVEAYLDNSHKGNLVTMTTSTSADTCKKMFKWDNPYSWTYRGNLAGKSEIKDNVSKVGGNIEAIVRCSLQWNDKDTPGIVDFDLHSSGSSKIFYRNKGQIHPCGGKLDVDMIRPTGVGIENITWQESIKDGNYTLGVKNYCGRSNTGFKVEIDIKGETFNYHVVKPVYGYVEVAIITVKGGEISISHKLPHSHISTEVYGLPTQEFHKVNLMCLSPNHWGENEVGNKHYFFMLDKCKAESSLRSFHSENLEPELAKHRKVLEVLGNTTKLEPEGDQLSGIGFNATVRDNLVVKLQGNFKRTLKIKF